MKLVYTPPPLFYAKAAKGPERVQAVNRGLQKKALSVSEMAIIAKPNLQVTNF
jgi:hypothetical protein